MRAELSPRLAIRCIRSDLIDDRVRIIVAGERLLARTLLGVSV